MDKRITIGRHPESDIRIDDTELTVSGSHADIVSEDGILIYTDHSRNGTEINGSSYRNASIRIKAGDRILLAGKVELRWEEISKHFPTPHSPTQMQDGKHRGTQSMEDIQNVNRQTKPYEQQNSADNGSNGSAGASDASAVHPTEKLKKSNVVRITLIVSIVAILTELVVLFNDIIFRVL